MIVKKNKVVDIHYTLRNSEGEILDSSEGKNPMSFLQGHGNIIPGLEHALEGMMVGNTCSISVKPKDAYGEYNDTGVQEIPLDAVQGVDNLSVGMQLQSQDENGNPFIVHIKDIKEKTITIDANHPLAGQTLHFDISIENIRDALDEEIDHGHVHNHNSEHHH